MLYKKVMAESGEKFVQASPDEVREAMMEYEVDKVASTPITSPHDAKVLVTDVLGRFTEERVVAFYFDAGNHLIKWEVLSTGTMYSTSLYPRKVVEGMIGCGGASVILAHNHPSNSATPSQADRRMTLKVKEALELFDCSVLDHIIATPDGSRFSFSESCIL